MGKDSLLPVSYKTIKLPEHKRDRFYYLFMILGVPFAVLWEGLVILPNYYDELCAMVVFHIVATLFIVYNILGNMLMLQKTDASGKQSILPSVLRPGWRFCYPCSLNSPPRSYHCTVCNECILKRDHHCAFAGCCVGYYNHRYYLLAVVYTLIGSIYGIYYQWEYVMLNIGGFGLWTLPCFVAPHFAYMIGWIPSYGILVIFLNDIGLTLMISMAYMLICQVIAISRGQTQYEMKHQVYDYDLSFSRNWQDVLGERWHLTWISAVIPSKLSGNGLKFTLASEYEAVKDI